MKYVFPALFTHKDEKYAVSFPDLSSCFTSGASISESLDNAQDVLNLVLMTMEDYGKPIPAPSDIRALHSDDNSFASLVSADTAEYRKLYGNQAVKKTLSIPAWLNTIAERKGVNFSFILQKALKAELDLE